MSSSTWVYGTEFEGNCENTKKTKKVSFSEHLEYSVDTSQREDNNPLLGEITGISNINRDLESFFDNSCCSFDNENNKFKSFNSNLKTYYSTEKNAYCLDILDVFNHVSLGLKYQMNILTH